MTHDITHDTTHEKITVDSLSVTTLKQVKVAIAASEKLGQIPIAQQRIFHLGRELKTLGRSLETLGVGRMGFTVLHVHAAPPTNAPVAVVAAVMEVPPAVKVNGSFGQPPPPVQHRRQPLRAPQQQRKAGAPANLSHNEGTHIADSNVVDLMGDDDDDDDDDDCVIVDGADSSQKQKRSRRREYAILE